jgi:hypothetical protein
MKCSMKMCMEKFILIPMQGLNLLSSFLQTTGVKSLLKSMELVLVEWIITYDGYDTMYCVVVPYQCSLREWC